MLLKFAIQNFRGFKDRMVWDLSNPNNYEFNTHAIKDGVIKNGIIYGPNGCGKTNFGEALFDIVNHLTQKQKQIDYYRNFVNAEQPNEPVRFEYLFRFDDKELLYRYSKDYKGGLIDEYMEAYGKTILVRNSQQVDTGEFTMADQMKNEFQTTTSAISLVSYIWSNYPLANDHILSHLRRFVDNMLWYKCLDKREFIGLNNGPTANIEDYIIKNNLLEEFADFLYDVSEQKFNLKALTVSTNQSVIVCSFQTQQGSEFVLPFLSIASTGTVALELLFYWIKQTENASLLFIDEFDAFYHFKLSFEVCQRLFHTNKQVFLTSHNTYLMTNDLLRPDCNFILDNNKIKSLVDCTDKELRFAHNNEKLYRGGKFKV